MQAEIKIPPTINVVLVLFAIPQNQGWPLISCTDFIQVLLPTLCHVFCCTPLLCLLPLFFSGFGLCFAEALGKYRSEEVPAFALFFLSRNMVKHAAAPVFLCLDILFPPSCEDKSDYSSLDAALSLKSSQRC